MKTLMLASMLLLAFFIVPTEAKPKPSGNFQTTTRYFDASGKYIGSKKSYSSGRSFYYDGKGKYQGQSTKGNNANIRSSRR